MPAPRTGSVVLGDSAAPIGYDTVVNDFIRRTCSIGCLLFGVLACDANRSPTGHPTAAGPQRNTVAPSTQYDGGGAENDAASVVDSGPTEWLRAIAAPIRLPEFQDDDFSDLAPLASMIGSARIVALGEESHGDGTAFRTKARLVRYLHEKHGFNVLAFETTMIDCEHAESEASRGAISFQRLVDICVPEPWGRTKQLHPLLAYMESQRGGAHPIRLAGFDIVPQGMTVDYLEAAFVKSGLTGRAVTDGFSVLRKTFFAMRDQKVSEIPSLMDASHKAVQTLKRTLLSRRSVDNGGYLSRALDTCDTAVDFYGKPLLTAQPDAGAPLRSKSIRDEEMARNAAWVVENRYPNDKIMIWAASLHLLRAHGTIEAPPALRYPEMVTMGERLSERFGKDYVAIAFAADDGDISTFGSGSRPIPSHPADTLESLMTSAGFENAFIDLHSDSPNAAWLHQPFTAGPLGYRFMRARWDQCFDGLIFNRHMEPSVLIAASSSADGGAPPSDAGADAHR